MKYRRPKLSICIPNYNRVERLKAGLSALGKQACPEMEVVVNDDLSNESIRPVTKFIQKKYPLLRLRFYTNQRNLGFDRNVLKTISLAKGEYCWLLSNDDLVLPGAIDQILKLIKRKPLLSLILVNYLRYSAKNPKLAPRRLIGLNSNHYFQDANDFFFTPDSQGYFPYLGQNCLTMSCNVFNKSDWDAALKRHSRKEIVGSNFVHTFLIPSLAIVRPEIFYLNHPRLKYLAHNSAPWPNHIWLDFNRKLIPFLHRQGYNPLQLLILWLGNWQFVLKESLLKTPAFYFWYQKLINR